MKKLFLLLLTISTLTTSYAESNMGDGGVSNSSNETKLNFWSLGGEVKYLDCEVLASEDAFSRGQKVCRSFSEFKLNEDGSDLHEARVIMRRGGYTFRGVATKGAVNMLHVTLTHDESGLFLREVDYGESGTFSLTMNKKENQKYSYQNLTCTVHSGESIEENSIPTCQD